MANGNRGDGICRRIALQIQYDGTFFNGWQIQNSGRTVQDVLEQSVRVLTKEECRITASGRTDAGVHALHQIVHFDTSSNIPLQRLAIGLNGVLPRDISVKNAYNVNCDFHSRFSAVRREYKYYIYNYYLRSPFMQYRAMWINQKIDIAFLREAASYLIGEMDFASFCKKKSSEMNTVRRIEDIRITERDNLIIFTIKGNAFLHNMIRIIIGTLVQMHKEGKMPEYMKEVLAGEDRGISGFTAPPYGLYLSNVEYNPQLQEMEKAF
ncbi:MAG TPA: tRNA pseudouridine(38-40) synthase TruA [Spirochaetota bacterium]|nr:tRNA pseudouridine(38-40) synthase TruA [Spirochaetota bacterium]